MSPSDPNLASPATSLRAYSAEVGLYLILADGRRIPLAQVGPDLVICREPMQFNGEPATVELSIDGEVRHRAVHMPVMHEPGKVVRVRSA
jgi:hypothetical protein